MLILASRSPRRSELLRLITDDFKVIPSEFDERSIDIIKPFELVRTLSRCKAKAVALRVEDCMTVIGCDTVVYLEGKIFGIPQTKEEAYSILTSLSGKTHSVITGVCILYGDIETSFECETRVTFFKLDDADILSYINTNEPYDKAGGYGIQGMGGLFVEKIDGDYTNVVGLPISRLNRTLKELEKNL